MMGRRTKPLIMRWHGGLTFLILLLSSHRTPSNSKKDKRERYKHQLLGATIIISHSQEYAKRREESQDKRNAHPFVLSACLSFSRDIRMRRGIPPVMLYCSLASIFSRMESSPINPHEGYLFSLYTYIITQFQTKVKTFWQ